MPNLKIRRALLTVSDKTGIAELGKALADAGAELVATGRTAQVLKDAGLKITPIESVSGSPEAFQGRMKTLSFPVCSGILYRRGDASDEKDLARLSIQPIDCVVVNFYPFEEAARKPGISREALIEEIDIGGPTLVRAAAKNAPDVLVLTSPAQYAGVIEELRRDRAVSRDTSARAVSAAWDLVLGYDRAIAERLGSAGAALRGGAGRAESRNGAAPTALRYGENPHQEGWLETEADSPIDWPKTDAERLTAAELSYNNILDLSAAYGLASDLVALEPAAQGVVIVKHNNPCGVAVVPAGPDEQKGAQKQALLRAWEGDPVSAFGGVLVFTHPIEDETASWLAERFVELIAAPSLTKGGSALKILGGKRKNLKAVAIRRFGGVPARTEVRVAGGRLIQTSDLGVDEPLKSVTKKEFPESRARLARFGVVCCRALKSNAIALVREMGDHGLQLIGAGQGQPNRIEALKALAIPRAQGVLRETGGKLADAVMISDAFFPFRDTVDAAAQAGIRYIVQPGGSIKDQESIVAADEHGVAMAFTGRRHFRH